MPCFSDNFIQGNNYKDKKSMKTTTWYNGKIKKEIQNTE